METYELETIETYQPEVVETLEPEIIEPEFVNSEILQPEVMQYEEPQVTIIVTSRIYSYTFFPLSHPQTLSSGVEEEQLLPGLLSLKENNKEEPTRPQTPIHIIGTPLYQAFPFVTPDTQLQAHLIKILDLIRS